MSDYARRGMGWKRDLPDTRDFTPSHPVVQETMRLVRLSRSSADLPASVDLREFFPSVTDQRSLNSSTAHACVALFQYFQRRTLGRIEDRSVLFLYKTTRKLLGMVGDTGADLRTTLKALIRCGLPPRKVAGYTEETFDAQPDPVLYCFRELTTSLQYVRLDGGNRRGKQTLRRVKSFLAAGHPAVFGFAVPASISAEPYIREPFALNSLLDGLAAVAVGYNDHRVGPIRGALLIRLSWGTGWGEHGYGWLPYSYVTKRLAADFWTLLKPDWLASGELHRPGSV